MTSPSEWMPTDGFVLEPNALAAVKELDANVAVAAGPGAGKTELLAQRANFLFTTGACPDPQRVIAISFKVDATTNLRQRVAERCGASSARRFDSYTFHAFARQIIARHRPHVADRVPPNFRVGPGRSEIQLHYNDLLPRAHDVLDKDPTAAAIIQQAYDFAFFDEFQDCTDEQYNLIHRLFAESAVRTTAVGDRKQRIMGFAHAKKDAMADYIGDFHAAERPIYLNHRSMLRLRRVQNAVIKVMDPGAASDEQSLTTPIVDGVPAEDGQVRVLQFATALDEGASLANLIEGDITNGTSPSEIAILAARLPAQHCEHLAYLLSGRGIPVRDERAAQDAFAEPVGELLIGAARLLILGHSPEDYMRLSRFMTLNCVDERQAAKRRRRLDDFLAHSRQQRRDALTKWDSSDQFEQVLYAFLKVCERQFLSQLSVEYADDKQLDLSAKQAIEVINVAIRDADTPAAAMVQLTAGDAVRLMTVHKSKGLEFDHVYFVAIENENYFGDNLEDERATFFVGITRARKKLVLSYAQIRPEPNEYVRRWDQARTAQAEFLSYALPESG